MPPTEQQQAEQVIQVPERSLSDKIRSCIFDAGPVEQAGLALMVIAIGLLIGLPRYVKTRRGGILTGITAVILGVIGYIAFDIQFLARHHALYGVSDEVRADCERLLKGSAKIDDFGPMIGNDDPNFPDSFKKIGAVYYRRPHPEMVEIVTKAKGSLSNVAYLYDPHRLRSTLEEPEFPSRAMCYRGFYVFVVPYE